jgi:hypothetical protein
MSSSVGIAHITPILLDPILHPDRQTSSAAPAHRLPAVGHSDGTIGEPQGGYHRWDSAHKPLTISGGSTVVSRDTENDSEPHVTPAQGKPAMSDTEPPPDVQAGFGDDAAGAIGSPAPLPDEADPTPEGHRDETTVRHRQ